MARRLVTVSDTGQLPPEVLAKIGETYVSRVEGVILVDNRVQFAIDNLASETPGAYKIPRYDKDGMFAINDGVEPEHPVNLGQLDARVPAGGVPLATQLQNGLMSTSDKTKLDSTLPRKPFPWGAKLSTLETGVVYYHNIIGYPVNANLSELPGILTEYRDTHSQAHTFEIIANEVVTSSSKIRSYVFNSHSLRVLYGADTSSISPATPWPDLTVASWKPLYISVSQSALLDGATNQSTADVLVKRDSTGRFDVLTPTASTHPVPKSYADNASNLSSGTVPAARLPLATASVNGAMSAANYALLNGATSLPTASTVVRRDSAGRHQVSDPSVATDATNKGYVDGKKWDGADITTGTVAPERIANATSALDGLMPKADKALLDGSTTSSTPSTLVRRSSGGGSAFNFITIDTAPTATSHAARKDYVDTQASNASNLTTGTVAPERIANATSALDGLMPKADKAKLDAATSNATASTVVMRNSAGAIGVGQPTAGGHAARKDYVDTQASNASNLTTGTVSPDRIANATSSLDGLMPKADKAKLDAATINSTAGTIAMRDANGMLATQTPTGPTHAANKSYVDTQASNASNLTSGTVSPDRIANATSALDGLMSKSDKAKLDTATYLATGSALAQRDSLGQLLVATPQNSTAATTKAYVDGKTWDGSDITTGTVNPARIANATSSLDGLMPKADKAKLDGATSLNTANTIVTRASNGRTNLGSLSIANAPTNIDDATRKDYVDAQDAKQVSLAGDLAGADLDTIITPGEYYSSTGSNATTANNYPINGSVGTLSVRRFHSSSVWVTQAMTLWSRNEVWVRSANSATGWTAWMLQANKTYVDNKTWSGSDITTGTINPARIANATASVDGLMSKADKALLDGAGAVASANRIIKASSTGDISVNTPTNSSHPTTKGYVDGKTWDGSDITTGTISPSRIANATSALDGLMAKADKAKLDGASSASTANTIMMTDAYGRFRVNTPSATTDAANKAYVDAKTWDGSDITSGTINQARIANATSSLNGLMSSTDKAKLDGAAYHPSGAALVMSSSAGYIKGMAMFVDETTPQQTQAHALTRKDYVDKKVADVLVGTEIPDNANLNNYTTAGVYHNSTNTSVASGSNYPSAMAGKLEVTRSGSGSMIYQMWTDYSSAGRIYYRTKYSTSWYAWKELINDQNVTSSSQDNLTTLDPEASGFNYDSYKSPNTYLLSGAFTDGVLEVFKSGSIICQRRTYTFIQTGDLKLKISQRFSTNGGSTWYPWRNA